MSALLNFSCFQIGEKSILLVGEFRNGEKGKCFMSVFVLLFISIVSEVFASSMLKLTNGFKRLWPSIGVVIGYGLAFYFLSITLQSLAIGTVYAIWAGLGTALTAIVGVFFYKEHFSVKKFMGVVMIIIGVVVLNFAGGAH